MDFLSFQGPLLLLLDGVRSLVDMVPGSAGAAGGAGGGVTLYVLDLSDVVEDLDKVKLCGGLGGGLTNDGSAGAVLGADGILTDSYGICGMGGSPALIGACAAYCLLDH